MKKFSWVIFLITFQLQAQAPQFDWAKKINGSGQEEGTAITTDFVGNLYISGYYKYSMNFDNITLNSPNHNDIFFAKMDVDGNVIWATPGSGDVSGYSHAQRIKVDSQGNVYVMGHFGHSFTFGDTVLNADGDLDVFIVKLDNFGNFIWARQMGGIGYDDGMDLLINDADELFLIGFFPNTIELDEVELESEGDRDVFIIKMDSDGNAVWGASAGGTGKDTGRGIVTDPSGNIFICGSFENEAHFGNHTITGTESSNLFIAKMNNEGDFLWAKTVTDTATHSLTGFGIDNNQNLYLSGTFDGGYPFGKIENVDGAGSDAFLSKYDSQGNIQWTVYGGGNMNDYGRASFTTKNGDTYLIGIFMGTAYFGDFSITSTSDWDGFITKIDKSGNFLWVKHIKGTGSEALEDLVLDYDGNVYAIGWFWYSAVFDDITLTGDYDVFVTKLNSDGMDTVEMIENVYRLYPNPVNETLFIDIDGSQKLSEVIIRDLSGKKIKTISVKDKKRIEVNFNALNKGVYLVEITEANGNRTVQKVIKN
ncbi:MAG: SBBP repeat-containing protein [Flavobacteriia bacterium]|nr:SBBP repeat-containing protein [Flavobacteriia bacterium]